MHGVAGTGFVKGGTNDIETDPGLLQRCSVTGLVAHESTLSDDSESQVPAFSCCEGLTVTGA